MKSPQELMAVYVGFLRGLYQVHQNAHWNSKGPNFYGNHLLFQRLYEAAQVDVDTAAEKTLGLFDELPASHINITRQVTTRFNAENYENDWIKAALAAEKAFLALSKKIYLEFQSSNKLTLGLDDMIMAIASNHEVNVYLLKQALS